MLGSLGYIVYIRYMVYIGDNGFHRVVFGVYLGYVGLYRIIGFDVSQSFTWSPHRRGLWAPTDPDAILPSSHLPN